MDSIQLYPSDSRKFRGRRIQNWVFLGLMYGFFYMSRYNFSAIQAVFAEKFGWSKTDYGIVISAGLLTYGISVFLNGPLSDRIGGKRTILIGAAGAAFFNFLFGLGHLFIKKSALWQNGKVIAAAELNYGLSMSSAIAFFAVIWALNHYFQSFGALSIVKINAAWFHRKERGRFAGIFGIMIQGGRQLAFILSPIIVRYLPWQYAFWLPALALVVMWVLCKILIENTPLNAGFSELDTGDETPEEAAQQPTLGFILKKIFARPAPWFIAFTSMCIGMVRHSIDHWYTPYISNVFGIKAALLTSFKPYTLTAIGMPFAAILGALAAGFASDNLFKSRRAPVICLAMIGQALCLAALWGSLHNAWAACLFLVLISFFIQSAHSLVGGASSMDFGGRKAVATAAGLFDGAQYLAGAIAGIGIGRLLDQYKVPGNPLAAYKLWPLFPLPFALLGAFLISRLWNVIPGKRAAH